MTSGATGHPVARRGFTLIELIVVIVVLGVVSGLVIPRMTSTELRRAEQNVKALGTMLTVVAERDTFGRHRMSLVHDPEARTISLNVLRQTGSSDRDRRWTQASWRPDPLTPEVRLAGLRLADVRFDGRPVAEDAWRVEFVPGIPRPLVEIVVEVDSADPGRPAWLIELLPYAPSADVVTVTAAGGVQGRAARSLDLDELGKSDVPW